MITSSGAKCDVCNKYILPILDEMVNMFSCKGIKETLHSCNKCKEIMLSAKGDWKKLPSGRLRKCFEDFNPQGGER